MKTVNTKNLKIGLFVSGLDRPWKGTPFPSQGFIIESESQIENLQLLCRSVDIDISKSRKPDTQKPVTVAAVPPSNEEVPIIRLPFRKNKDEPVAYNPQTALEFFQEFGKPESFEQGATILTEGQKPNRLLWQHNKMYLLVEGEVNIIVASQQVNTINAGEIFGELTPLILTQRTATAIANRRCQLLSLDETDFLAGIKKKPEFSLMLMDVLVKRIRQVSATVKTSRGLVENKAVKGVCVFSRKMLHNLVENLGNSSITYLRSQQDIFQQGVTGTLMYVILEGRAIVIIDNKVVERCSPGSVIGEISIVDHKTRLAQVQAETDCSLLAINRPKFVELVKSQPDFALSILRLLASRLYFSIKNNLQ